MSGDTLIEEPESSEPESLQLDSYELKYSQDRWKSLARTADAGLVYQVSDNPERDEIEAALHILAVLRGPQYADEWFTNETGHVWLRTLPREKFKDLLLALDHRIKDRHHRIIDGETVVFELGIPVATVDQKTGKVVALPGRRQSFGGAYYPSDNLVKLRGGIFGRESEVRRVHESCERNDIIWRYMTDDQARDEIRALRQSADEKTETE